MNIHIMTTQELLHIKNLLMELHEDPEMIHDMETDIEESLEIINASLQSEVQEVRRQ